MQTALPHRRRGAPRVDAGRQSTLGFLALGLVLATLLWNGGTPAVAWSLLCLATLVIFAVQVAFDVTRGLPGPARQSLWIAPAYVAVLLWLQVQSMPGLASALAHPVWAFAPEGAAPTISAAPDNGWKVVMRFTCYAMLFWILLRSSAEARDGAMGYIRVIAVFTTALAVYGFASKVVGFNYLLNAEESTEPLRASLWNRNSYATVAVFGVLANITAYVETASGGARRDGVVALRDAVERFFSGGWIFAFGVLVGLGAIAMTLSRGGAFAGAAGIVVLVLALRRGDGKGNMAALAIPVALAVFVALFMTSGIIARIDLLDQDARPDIFRQTIVGILDRPLLGHGAGAYHGAFRPYVPIEQAAWDWEKAHNSYLENGFEFGLPAAALFYLALGLVGWRLLTGVRTRRRHRSTPAFALACFTAASIHSLVDFSLQIPAIAALFAAILGLGWGQSFPTRSGSSTGKTRGPDRVRA